MRKSTTGRLPWRDLLDAAVRGHDQLDPHPGGPALAHLDAPAIRSWEEGRIDAEWSVVPELTNLRGELFGGYYGVLADIVLSFTAMTIVTEDERFKTQDLQIQYFRPAAIGPMRIEGKVVNRSRSLIHAEARFLRQDGKALARAQAVFAVILAAD